VQVFAAKGPLKSKKPAKVQVFAANWPISIYDTKKTVFFQAFSPGQSIPRKKM